MDTLRSIEQRLYQYVKEIDHQKMSALQSGDSMDYNLSSLKYEMFYYKIKNGEFMDELMYRVRSHMTQYNREDKNVEIPIESIHLNYEEFRQLVAVIGMFYPMCFKPNVVFAMNSTEKEIIRSATEATLEQIRV